jgi:hypothetical protein
MRTITLTGIVLIALATLGCGKKSEDQAEKTMMDSTPAAQKATPAPMQSMDSEGSQPTDESSTESQDNGEGDSQDDHSSSNME